MNPAKRRDLVRSIGGAPGEGSDRPWQDAVNCGVAAVEASCHPYSLVARTKRHSEGEPERAMESANAVGENARMFGNGTGDPRMGELQEERASGAEKEHGFACHVRGQ